MLAIYDSWSDSRVCVCLLVIIHTMLVYHVVNVCGLKKRLI